jgi:hypothetical protein
MQVALNKGWFMHREILRELKGGALDALRLYAALMSAPFLIAKAFVMRPPGAPFKWPPDGKRVS